MPVGTPIRETQKYLERSIDRLSILADRPLATKIDVATALVEYGYVLLEEQAAVLSRYVKRSG